MPAPTPPTDPPADQRAQTSPPAVLLTRPRADSLRFAGRLGGTGANVIISPLIHIVPVACDPARLRAAGGVVFTSAHAVPAAAPGRGRVAICVGARTAEVARRAGFRVVTGPGDAAGLAPLIAAQGGGAGLIHARGAHVAQTLPLPSVIVYDQLAQPLTDAARRRLCAPGRVVAPIFSARSAALLAQAVAALAEVQAALHIVAISPKVAAAYGGPRAGLDLATSPDAAAMARAVRATLRRSSAAEQT